MKEFTVFKLGFYCNAEYSLKGLVAINKESYDNIQNILNELKDYNYMEIIKFRNENVII